jgi:hypothetical protein
MPGHNDGACPIGVSTYVTLISLFVVLIRVSLIKALEPDPGALLMPETGPLDHVKVVPGKLLPIV